MLQIRGRESYLKRSVPGHRYVACFFTHYNAYGICYLAHAESCAVTQAQFLGYMHIMAHRQYTTGRGNPPSRYNHGAVMQRRILEKYIFYEPRVYIGIYYVPGLLIIHKRYIALKHDQGAVLLLLILIQA